MPFRVSVVRALAHAACVACIIGGPLPATASFSGFVRQVAQTALAGTQPAATAATATVAPSITGGGGGGGGGGNDAAQLVRSSWIRGWRSFGGAALQPGSTPTVHKISVGELESANDTTAALVRALASERSALPPPTLPWSAVLEQAPVSAATAAAQRLAVTNASCCDALFDGWADVPADMRADVVRAVHTLVALAAAGEYRARTFTFTSVSNVAQVALLAVAVRSHATVNGTSATQRTAAAATGVVDIAYVSASAHATVRSFTQQVPYRHCHRCAKCAWTSKCCCSDGTSTVPRAITPAELTVVHTEVTLAAVRAAEVLLLGGVLGRRRSVSRDRIAIVDDDDDDDKKRASPCVAVRNYVNLVPPLLVGSDDDDDDNLQTVTIDDDNWQTVAIDDERRSVRAQDALDALRIAASSQSLSCTPDDHGDAPFRVRVVQTVRASWSSDDERSLRLHYRATTAVRRRRDGKDDDGDDDKAPNIVASSPFVYDVHTALVVANGTRLPLDAMRANGACSLTYDVCESASPHNPIVHAAVHDNYDDRRDGGSTNDEDVRARARMLGGIGDGRHEGGIGDDDDDDDDDRTLCALAMAAMRARALDLVPASLSSSSPHCAVPTSVAGVPSVPLRIVAAPRRAAGGLWRRGGGSGGGGAALSKWTALAAAAKAVASAWTALARAFKTTTKVEVARVKQLGFDYVASRSTTYRLEGVTEARVPDVHVALTSMYAIPPDGALALTPIEFAENVTWTLDQMQFSTPGGFRSLSIFKCGDARARTADFVVLDSTMRFAVASDILVVHTQRSVLGGLFESDRTHFERAPHTLTMDDVEQLRTFFYVVSFGRLANELAAPYVWPAIGA